MNTQPIPLTLALLATVLAPPSLARGLPTLIDSTPPVGVVEMDDRTRTAEIINTEFGNFRPDGTPVTSSPIPAALGCSYWVDYGAMYFWNQTHPEYDYVDPAVLANTYHFSDVYPDYTFTLRASDANGIRKVTVKIRERVVQVHPYTGVVTDDGPTQFMDLWPSQVVAGFRQVWLTGGNFSHFEKRLDFEPRQTRLPTEEIMHFDMSTFGSTAKLEIEVEDNAGNVAYGAVYLAPTRTCPYG